MKRIVSVLALSFFAITNIIAQQIEAYPSNWFANMNNNKVQLLLRSTSVDFSKATMTTKYPGIVLKKTTHFKNSHYIALDVEISANAKPGNVSFAILIGPYLLEEKTGVQNLHKD